MSEHPKSSTMDGYCHQQETGYITIILSRYKAIKGTDKWSHPNEEKMKQRKAKTQ